MQLFPIGHMASKPCPFADLKHILTDPPFRTGKYQQKIRLLQRSTNIELGPSFANRCGMQKIYFILLALLCAVEVAVADVPEPVSTSSPAMQISNFDGAVLYTQNCADCHGALEKTRIPDRRPSRIASAIKTFGVMGDLKHLSALEVIAIAKALGSEKPLSSAR